MVLPTREGRVLLTHRPRLLVDVDEVLGDFQAPVLKLMSHITGKEYVPEDFTEWDIFNVLSDEQRNLVFACIERPGFCASIKPTPGSLEAVKELQTFCEVVPVTSPFHSTPWVNERTAWLGDYFGWKKREIVFTSAKHLVVGDGLADDKPDNVEAWAAYHPDGVPMLWHIPNTRLLTDYDKYRVRSWQEVIDKMRSFVR